MTIIYRPYECESEPIKIQSIKNTARRLIHHSDKKLLFHKRVAALCRMGIMFNTNKHGKHTDPKALLGEWWVHDMCVCVCICIVYAWMTTLYNSSNRSDNSSHSIQAICLCVTHDKQHAKIIRIVVYNYKKSVSDEFSAVQPTQSGILIK